MGGCLTRAIVLVALVAGVYAAWRWDPVVMPEVREWLGLTPDAEEVTISPEVAAATLERLDRFLAGEGDSLAVGGAEVTSVLRYSVPELVPPDVSEPRIRISDGTVRIDARVAREAFPDLPDLEQVAQVLPDTVPVELGAAVMPFGDAGAALLVRRVEVGGFPLPRRFHPRVLEAMGRRGEPGLPPEAMLLPLPPGVARMYVQGDSLILVTGR